MLVAAALVPLLGRHGGLPLWLAALPCVPPVFALLAHALVGPSGAEQPLLPLGAALNSTGLLVLTLIAPQFAALQAIWTALCLAGYALALAFLAREQAFARLCQFLFPVAAGLTALTFAVGTNPMGAGPRQWLAIGPLYFQPSELLKLGLALLLSRELGEGRRGLLLPLLATGLSVALLLGQEDLGTALIVLALAALLAFAARGGARHFALAGGVVAASAAALYLLAPRAQQRLRSWLFPYSDPFGAAYQVIQAWRALASGGPLGKGLLPGELLHIPAAHTDMIFPVALERLGLLGLMWLVGGYGLLLRRMTQLGRLAASKTLALTSLGLSVLVVGQAILIAGGSTGLLPLTGVTLPFVSYGGSSLLACYLALAVADARPFTSARPEGAACGAKGRVIVVQRLLLAGLGVIAAWAALWQLAGTTLLERFGLA